MRRVAQGRAISNIQDRPMIFSPCGAMNRVDASRRQNQAGRIDVCGGNAELAAQPVATLHNARERVFTPQHLPGLIQIARANSVTNSCAADSLFIQGHCGKPMHNEVQLLPQRLKQGDASAASKAKVKAASHANAMNSPKRDDQFTNEFFTRLAAELFVELQQ